MHWLNKHARLRYKLSPYIDDQLTASETAALEAHLASCDACRRRLDELRATVSALHEQPQAEAPRSFAITPGMLERKSADAARPLPALGLGMRLAGAGVAVALAVVVVGDLTLVDNGGASPQAGSQPAEESRGEMFSAADTSKSSESGAYPPPSGNADSSTTQSNAGAAAPCPPATAPAATGGGAAGGADTTAGRGVGETPAPSATQQPAPSSTPSPESPNVAAICGSASGGAAVPIAPQTPENAAPRATADNDGGGISTLRIAEIALAGVLVAIVAAIVLEAAMRRRRIA